MAGLPNLETGYMASMAAPAFSAAIAKVTITAEEAPEDTAAAVIELESEMPNILKDLDYRGKCGGSAFLSQYVGWKSYNEKSLWQLVRSTSALPPTAHPDHQRSPAPHAYLMPPSFTYSRSLRPCRTTTTPLSKLNTSSSATQSNK